MPATLTLTSVGLRSPCIRAMVPVPVVRYILEQAGLTEKEWETL